jgi:hypothetical protein
MVHHQETDFLDHRCHFRGVSWALVSWRVKIAVDAYSALMFATPAWKISLNT